MRQLIVEQLVVEEDRVVPDASFVDDLNADSLDLVELIMAMQDAFNDVKPDLEVTDEEAEKIRYVQDSLDYLESIGITDKALAAVPA
jgi:acyl carrier protein